MEAVKKVFVNLAFFAYLATLVAPLPADDRATNFTISIALTIEMIYTKLLTFVLVRFKKFKM